jgi:hypothetical protein
MVAAVVPGSLSARRRDSTRHRAWMTRSYAIGLVAGTQVFTLGIGAAVFGHAPVATVLLMTAGWGINLAVAEWAIRRPARRSTEGSGRAPVPRRLLIAGPASPASAWPSHHC